MIKTSLGDVNEDWVNNSRPVKRVLIPDAALLVVRAIGRRYFEDKSGSVVDCGGVGGTGSAKTLTFASSPAVK
jgi:hypothetical protein